MVDRAANNNSELNQVKRIKWSNPSFSWKGLRLSSVQRLPKPLQSGTQPQHAEAARSGKSVNIDESVVKAVENIDNIGCAQDHGSAPRPIPAPSFTTLPNEILIEIVQYLRPHNPREPITGLNAAWTSYSAFRDSVLGPQKTRRRLSRKKPEKQDLSLVALRL